MSFYVCQTGTGATLIGARAPQPSGAHLATSHLIAGVRRHRDGFVRLLHPDLGGHVVLLGGLRR